jgi:hypothetical protein
MSTNKHGRDFQKFWFVPAIVAVVAATALLEYAQGRNLICTCGRVLLWFGDAWASGTSQHLLDPYSFTHMLHGFLLCWLILWLLPRWRGGWQLWLAMTIECGWELLENSTFVIQRYRTQTAALGYAGDSIVNSVGDVLICGLGFLLARKLGFRRSLVGFALVEVTLLFLYRDSLLLNIVMLLVPIKGLQAWQAGH